MKTQHSQHHTPPFDEQEESGRVIRGHEDVPNDTVGQSILEAYWWLALVMACQHAVFACWVLEALSTYSDFVRSLHRTQVG
jgi:hypothetical protein